MTNKEYFFQEMRMTDEQLERAYDFWLKNRKCENGDTVTPSHDFTIKYSFSSIATTKVMVVKGNEFWIDELEFNP